jgi:hypothetical protein
LSFPRSSRPQPAPRPWRLPFKLKMADDEKKVPVEASNGNVGQVEQITTKEAGTGFVPPTPEEERRVIRKLDWRLLPLVFVLYSLSVLDRSNLGNAKLAGLTEDIDLKGNRYNWLGTIFYIAYILFQWTCMGWKQFKPHNWCAWVVLFWGFVATIQATAFNWGG